MNIFEKLTNQMTETLDSGLSLALHHKNAEVKNLHILYALINTSNSTLNQVLNKMNAETKAIELALKRKIDTYPKTSTIRKEDIKLQWGR